MQSCKELFKISDFVARRVPALLGRDCHHDPDHQKQVAAAIDALAFLKQCN
jgi:hypothetical protein